VRRIALWFAGTVSVVVLLFGYHTSTSGVGVSAGSPPAVISAVSSTDSSSTGSSSTSTAKTKKKATSSTVTGATVQTQWGPVQVQLTVVGKKITDVSVLQYPNGNGQDAQINASALPTLIQETISAQSAGIDMVSGATFTSTGYIQSLQSALDKANL